jgi:hypothetical protein
MVWINGQWVEDTPGFGGGREDELIYGGTFDAPGGMTRPGFPSQHSFGDRPGVPNLPPQMNPPGYSRGPQMQSSLFGGMLGNIDPWNPVQQPVQQPQFQPLPSQMFSPLNIPGRLPAPQPPMSPLPENLPSLPPQNIFGPDTVAQPPTPPVMPPPTPPTLPPMGPPRPPEWQSFPPLPPVWPPGGDVVPPPIPTLPPGPKTDHEFNVMQRERTKLRLAGEREKTKRHYAKLRAKGASKTTIAKAKAKSKARSAKIKGQSVRRSTIVD